MSTSPLSFAENLLKQPYPTMGLAPSSANTRTGGTVVQEGTGASRLGQTNDSMFARISAGVPFGWVLGLGRAATDGAVIAGAAVKQKVTEGAQAVEGKVKSITQPISGFFASYVAYSKWIIIGLVAVAFIVFAAQVKTLIPSAK